MSFTPSYRTCGLDNCMECASPGRGRRGEGLRCNPNKLLLDPHARAITGHIEWGQSVFSHDFGDPDRADESDSAGAMPRGSAGRRGSLTGGMISRPEDPT